MPCGRTKGREKERRERERKRDPQSVLLLPVQSLLLRNLVPCKPCCFHTPTRPHGKLRDLLTKSSSSLSTYFAIQFRQVLKNTSEEAVFALIQSLHFRGRKHFKMTFHTRVVLHRVNSINKLNTQFSQLQDKDKLPYSTSCIGRSNRHRK